MECSNINVVAMHSVMTFRVRGSLCPLQEACWNRCLSCWKTWPDAGYFLIL